MAKEVADDLPQIHLKVNLIVDFKAFILCFLHEDAQGRLLECLHLNQNDDEVASQSHLTNCLSD